MEVYVVLNLLLLQVLRFHVLDLFFRRYSPNDFNKVAEKHMQLVDYYGNTNAATEVSLEKNLSAIIV